MRVLIVEDDTRVAHFITQALNESGYVVDHCAHGETGLDRARQSAYDAAELYEHLITEKAIELQVRFERGLRVMADAVRLRRAFANLMDNAVKYTRPGGRIEVTMQRAEGVAVILFRDRGDGIAADDLPRIWDRHYRAKTSRHLPGLGLGLSVVRAMVEAMSGAVSVTSAIGEGSCFVIRLPISR